jgi:hypothetical protein
MHPARVIGIQFHRAAHYRRASFELARVHDLQSQDPERIGVKRVEGHRALGRSTKGRKVLAEEVRLRKHNHRELVRPIQFDSATGRSQGPIERGFAAREAKRVFVEVDLRKAGPEVRLPVVPLHRALQPAFECSVGRGRNLLAVGETLELPLSWSEVGVVLLLSSLSQRMNRTP